jgi:hypothetical protein
LFRDGQRLGVVSTAAHADMSAVIDSGLEFHAELFERVLVLNLPADAATAP